MSISKKIRTAREILVSYSKEEYYYEQNTIQKLREITDRADLAYNDVIVKRSRTKSAIQSMKDLENKLDMLILEAKKVKEKSRIV